MKIALIGNMNNNFFSILRYLRDLGMDAHLFMYTNEYKHFLPESDTFHISQYKDYIHTLSMHSSGKGLILANTNKIKRELKEYDFFIGCGIAPALFMKLNWVLDIFIPYADEMELTEQESFKFSNIIKYPVRRYTVNKQIKAIQTNTTAIIASAVQEITKDTIRRLNLSEKHHKKYLLMLYKEKNTLRSKYIDLMSNHNMVLFSHTRHHWRDLTQAHEKKDGGKGVDKLIIGYAKFIKNNPSENPLLLFFEYGKDVDASKELILELGIEKYVVWLPLMLRKEILGLIEYADIVVDAIGSEMWGGVGWEGLSCGKVLMQNIVQSDEEYYREMGHELPFIMKSNSPEQVEAHLNAFIENREYYKTQAEKNKEWFNTHAGVGLAKEYKKIIEELYTKKKK